MTIRVLLADDQEMVRDGLATMLGSAADIEVVGEAGNGREVIDRAAELRPNVVVMDIRMPELDGLKATAQIVSRELARVLVLTTFDLDEYVYEALHAGASGFLLKNAPIADLLHGVRVVAAGDSLLAPSITTRLIRDITARHPHARRDNAAVAALTEREVDVLRALSRGLSNAEIAAELFVSEQTVKTHVGRLLTKLALRDRTQAVIFAYENGLAGS